ncbi:pro-cathepsin H-like [Pararge aegeria]|uniref:pro-cathepsin H-like n=1 Tax=Pararge aegeria TaxID=116150 RepID=UPI0019D232DD|nr:pro-cathepsin H-like [Pararge aegeria]
MASLYLVLVLVSALDPGFTYTLDVEQKAVIWPEVYHMKGDTMNILSGIIKPFEIWYSKEANKSRIDYYGGIVKHYYIAATDDDYGKEYVINPVTTEEVTNVDQCREEIGQTEVTNFLPEVEGYTFEGQETYNDKLVDVWKYLDIEEDKEKTEITLIVFRNEEGFDIPVLKEIKASNLWTGTLSSHKVSRFYDLGKPELDELDYSLEESCNETEVMSSDLMEQLHALPTEVEDAFTSYIIRHGKNYENDEHEMRKQIFMKNWRNVVEHNKQNLSYKMVLNKFSDWTDNELARLRATRPAVELVGTVPFPHTEEEVDQLVQELPENFDMRIEGYITSVKNQATCGSCWAFSTTAAVEGALARSNGGRDLDLSEQSMVDCAWGFDNMGCSGGTVDGAFRYILKHGLPTQMEYGLYLDEMGRCKLENMTKFYNIRGFAAVPPLSVNAMKVALYKYGPVTVAINANERVMNYNNGIFFDPTCNDDSPNHGVVVVGYGVRDGVDYWIVKNSWGEDYGEDGYILFSATENNCHLLEGAFYPIV